MPAPMKTLVVIPAYNEAENLPRLLAEIAGLALPVDLLVVDDSSSDDTAAVAERAGAGVVRLPFNLGYGAAVQTGLRYGVDHGYDACVLLDGDGQHDPRHIPDLMAPLASRQADLALGSRFLGSASYTIPWNRRLGMRVFSYLASRFTHQQITDPTSGYQAIGRRLTEFFIGDNYPYDFPDADTLIRLYFAGFRIKEVAVTIRPRLHGQSMHSGARTLYYIYKMFFSIFVAVTQRRMLMKEDVHAARHQDSAGAVEPDGAAGHRPAGAPETPR